MIYESMIYESMIYESMIYESMIYESMIYESMNLGKFLSRQDFGLVCFKQTSRIKSMNL